MPTPTSRRWPTYPAPKYGPTTEYGTCELASCTSDARATCEHCGGEFCLSHSARDDHAEPPGTQERPAGAGDTSSSE